MFFKSWLGSNRVRSVRTLLVSALSLALLVLTGACTVTTATDATATGTGNLVVDWTIASAADSAQCSAHGAQTISIQLFNSSGLRAGLTTASCATLSATFNALPVGNYSIQAQLVDVNGGALASLAAPVATAISDLTTTTTLVDFPAAAFTTPVAGTGTLEVDWTIGMVGDGSLCATHSAQTLSVQVFNASNVQYGAATQVPCSALTTSIVGLPQGTYTIQAQMLDVNGQSISSIIGPLAETITDGLVTTQKLDFPDDSFGAVTANPTTGSLNVTWTVAGTATAAACTSDNAANIVLQLLDSNNALVGTAQSTPCANFTAALSNVAPGTYTLTAKLVDSVGSDVTTTATVPGITIVAATATAQPVDFPTTSFLTSAAGTGSINVTWTIAEGTSTASCGAHNAASISLQLYQAVGVTPIGAALIDPCTAFTATLTNLTPGSYALSAQLVNSTTTVSTLIPPQPIMVTAGATATQAFDFPSNAF